MDFSEKLKKHRKNLGMSQEELSYQLNVSRQAVSKWENGQGFPETEKLLLISNLFNVSLDYLLKEDPSLPLDDNEKGYYANHEVVEGFLATKAAGARRIALGVLIIIISSIFPIITESDMGVVLLLCSVALGVGILVLNRFAPNRYRQLQTQALVFDPAFLREFRDGYEYRRKQHGVKIVLGIIIIMLSVVFVTFVDNVLSINSTLTDAGVPFATAFAVYLFIIAGSALKNEKIIAFNNEHMKEVEKEKSNAWLFGTVMPLATMAFLAIGFKTNQWHPAWLIFPVVALGCKFILALVHAIKP